MSNFDESTNSWPMVDFAIKSENIELVSDLLWSMGVVAIEERTDDISGTTLRTSMGDDPENAIAQVLRNFPDITVTRIDIDRAVADTWREHAVATWVNDEVVLVPAWVSPPDNCTPIFIEPLDTFGLGNHPTTVLTLRLALQHISSPTTVFDLGCGSGVLAVGLAALRHCTCFTYDIADNAQKAVQNNATLNGVKNVSWVNGYPAKATHVVLANILAPVLIEESQRISLATESRGLLVLSGMRNDQVEKVLDEFSEFTELNREELDGWVAVALQKN